MQRRPRRVSSDGKRPKCINCYAVADGEKMFRFDPRRLLYSLQYENATDFHFDEAEGETTVKWSMSGERDFMTKAMTLVMDMDAMIGGDFEKGLAKLKEEAEGEAESNAKAEEAGEVEAKAQE